VGGRGPTTRAGRATPPRRSPAALALSRRSETLIAVAPKLRAKPADKIVGLGDAEDDGDLFPGNTELN
jgi:hypothetical protein